MISCNNGSTGGTTQQPKPPVTKAWETATVNFKAFPAAGDFPIGTLDFSPSAVLPAGVTYKLTDDKGNSWEPSKSGFNGQVTAIDHYSTTGPVTFTQTFYLNGTKITSVNGERTVGVGVSTFSGMRFSSLVSDTGAVTLVHP